MKILAIETSCDETAIAYIETTETDSGVDFSVLGNVIHSQVEMHKEYGGVFPAVAKREHQINLPLVLDQVMQGLEIPDMICVTSGPGLEPALWCGIVFAKELAVRWNVPVVPVNHMEGHILSVYKNDIQFPALALLISGGHTELVLVNDIGDYKIIGRTRDDAVGEAFDKVARLLGLPYPGGPEISKLADLARQNDLIKRFDLPRPMIHSKDYDFSFSGLKTAVLYYTQSLVQPISDQDKQEIAHEFQNAVADVLVKKTFRACEEFGIQTLIVAGGVSANNHIKQVITEKISQLIPVENILFPTRDLTGDNALMIAIAGYFKHKKNPDTDYGDIRAEGNLSFQ